MNTTDNKVLMTTKENKKKSNYFCSYFKIKRRVVKAIATAMCAVMCVTSIDLTAFAVTGDADSDINIVSVDLLSDEIANQKVKPGATLEDIIFPASLDVHVIDSDDKDIEVDQGEDVDVPEEINEEGNQESNEPEQNVPTEEPTEEGNQPDDTQNENTQNNNTQGEDAAGQPDGEQIAKITNCGYDIETVYVPMEYCATEPSEEEVVVETLEKDETSEETVETEPQNETYGDNVGKDDVDEELSNGENSENNTATKKEIVNEEIGEDVTVSVEWSIDEENSSKTEFKDLEAGEEYIFVPTITEDGYWLAEEAELPVIKVTVEDGKAAAFEQSITVDGVVITVTADVGVFPEDATIEARKVTTSEEKEVEEAIDEVRDEEKNVAVSYTFDITIYDKDGNEIEPDTSKGSVKVTFKMAEIANENLETDVYHLEETDDGLTAESLTVITEENGNGENGEDENRKDKAENTENGNEENVEDDDAETFGKADDEVTVKTNGFSFYTVEFTYGELQYVLEGDKRVALSEILENVGIKENGEIDEVEGSNDDLFKPVFDEEENAWYIESLKAFSSKEWLKVTIDGIEYEIVVTDDQAIPGDWDNLRKALNGTLTKSVDGQLEISSEADVTIIKLLTDFTAKTGDNSLGVNGNRTLDLNGYTINGKISDSESVGSVITINPSAKLTLTDSSTDKTGTITGGNAWDGGGVYVNDGQFVMEGGILKGNKATSGGGVKVAGSGTFNMTGGTITDNEANNGGGVYVEVGSTFTLSGSGQITNNTSSMGGGVYNSGSFTMSGDSKIEENSGTTGGAVYLNYDEFTMESGTIEGNIATGNGGGVYFATEGTLKLGGTAVITGNKLNGTENNVYLHDNQTITIADGDGVPADGMLIRVTIEVGEGPVTGESTGQYARYFGSDDVTKAVVNKDDRVQIVSKDSVVACVTQGGSAAYYDSLQSAIDAAVSGDTVQLLRDIDGKDISVDGAKEITLDLNGKVLKGTGTKSVVTIKDNAELTLEDSRNTAQHYDSFADLPAGGVITGGKTSHGGGVLIMGGSFTMKAGTICRNTATNSGGGVCVGKSDENDSSVVTSNFIMNGGSITDNKGILWGGGVCVGPGKNKKANFLLRGGKISQNESKDGGGVHVGGPGSDVEVSMVGGTISENVISVGGNGGGGISLYFYNSASNYSFRMSGGTVSNNSTSSGVGGGVKIVCSGTGKREIIIGGDSKISGNTKDVAPNNVYLPTGKCLTLGTGLDEPKSDMSVGITLQSGTGNVTDAEGTGKYVRYFTSDNADYAIRNVGNVVKLIEAGAITNKTPLSDKDTNHGHITISKTSAFAGDTVEVTVTPETGYVLKTLTYNTNPIARDTSGKYSFAMPNADVEVKAAFEVARGTSVVVTPPTAIQNLKYTGSAQQLVTAGEAENGTMYYAIGSSSAAVPTEGWSTSVPTGISAGTYYVWYKSMGDPGYIDSTPECVQATIVNRTPDPTPAPDPGPNPQPTPNPSPEPDDPVVTPTAAPKGVYAETGLATKRYVPNGGTTAGIGNIIGTTANGIPLPYVTSDADKAGWTSIDQALVAYKKTKASKTEPFSVTMNGYATVDNQLLSDVYTQKVDLGINLDNDVVVIVPKENNVISDAIKELSDDVYFRVSAITTGDAKSNRMNDAGLDIKDILAIGGDSNTPVIKVVASNKAIGLSKNRMIQLIFDTTKMTDKYKPGATVYLYTGSAKAGVGCYTVGKVDKNGKVSFWVPMVSNYWTIGNKNLGTQIRKH